MEIMTESMSLKSNKLVNPALPTSGEKEYIKNEGITRDVIENNGDEKWHPVMLMKNK
ncbi:MAG: hypothetical protein ABSF71_10445 [Terriglobia bacterium]|jgi:hypothetical protein